MSGRLSTDRKSDEPATLHRVMQATLAQGLKERYKVEREIPHELFVLLMQINGDRKQK